MTVFIFRIMMGDWSRFQASDEKKGLAGISQVKTQQHADNIPDGQGYCVNITDLMPRWLGMSGITAPHPFAADLRKLSQLHVRC